MVIEVIESMLHLVLCLLVWVKRWSRSGRSIFYAMVL